MGPIPFCLVIFQSFELYFSGINPPLDWYCRFDLPSVVGELLSSLGSVFRSNIDEEKSFSLVAIQPG